MPWRGCYCWAPLAVVALNPAAAVAQVSGDVERRLQDEQQRERLEQLQQQLREPQQPLIEGRPQPPGGQPPGSATPEPEQAPPIQGIELEGAALPPLPLLDALRQRFVGRPADAATLSLLRTELVSQLEAADLLAQVGEASLGANGVVLVPLVVARLGAVRIAENKAPIAAGWAIATVLDAVGLNNELRLDKLESALLKLNDLGGVKATARLEPGQQPGTTDVLLTLTARRQLLGEVGLNNHTTQYTGPYQLQANVALQGLLGRGEILQLNGSYSGNPFDWGSRSAGFNLNVPLTPGGLSAVAALNASDYRLLQEFQVDNYTGAFIGGSLGLSQVLWRRPKQNLSWRAVVDRNHFNDSVLGIQYSNRSTWAGRLSLAGDSQDQWLGLGINSGIVTLSAGTLQLDGPDEDALDALVADRAGPWGKVNLLLNRYQMFRNSPWSVELQAQGQLAFSNLDSVEKMSLGWPNGVRAYPPGEASGDSGVVGQSTLRYQLARNVVAKAFVDGGYIWRWTRQFVGALNPNGFGLWGPGLGLEWGTRGDVLASVDVAWPIGVNNNSLSGLDADGTDAGMRVWISLRKWL
jgi:hemolysin activation/secretion protein